MVLDYLFKFKHFYFESLVRLKNTQKIIVNAFFIFYLQIYIFKVILYTIFYDNDKK
jgi:hypothetical protein